MLEPLNRSQSPISTASANPVSVADAAQTCQPPRQRGELAVVRQRDDLLVQAGAATGGQHHRLIRVLESRLRRRGAEALLTQPAVVRLGPRLAAAVDDPVPQQQFRHPMPGPHQILPRRLPSPDQITGGLLGQARDPHRAQPRPTATTCARCSASRASVFTRSPAGRCNFDDAATSHRTPAAVNARANPNPVGPDSYTTAHGPGSLTDPLEDLGVRRRQPRPKHLTGLGRRSPPRPPTGHAHPAQHSYAHQTPGPPSHMWIGRARDRAR